MTRRAPAARGKADRNHRSVADAIRALGYPVMDLSAAGGGVEDLLVGLRSRAPDDGRGMPAFELWWLPVECKVARNKRGVATESQFTDAQKEWRARTEAWPRLTVTSAQDAVDQIRRLTG